jgi:hypothetical protein
VKCSRKEVQLFDESFLYDAKPTDAQQEAACERLVENTLELPKSGSCLVRREGPARGLPAAPAASFGDRQLHEKERNIVKIVGPFT